jgi:hypothetical protein
MWKGFGVAALWVGLISLPHAMGPVLQGGVAGAAPPLVLPVEDPGDPFRLVTGATRAQGGGVSGTFATVYFRNELGKTLTLVEATFVMDGKELPPLTNVKPDENVVVFSGRVEPGHHIIKTTVTCQGNKRGIITYTKGYRWKVTSDQVLTIPDNRAVVYKLAAHRSRAANVPFEKQIEIRAQAEVLPGGESLTN